MIAEVLAARKTNFSWSLLVLAKYWRSARMLANARKAFDTPFGFIYQQIQYLRKYDNLLISRQLILGIKNHRRKGWSSKHSEQTFQPFNQLTKLYIMHNITRRVLY